MRLILFGMDGNLLDNYSFKAKCAGKALAKQIYSAYGKKISVARLAKIYVQTSGMKSQNQFRHAFGTFGFIATHAELEATEKDFRKNLRDVSDFRMFPDVAQFLAKNWRHYMFGITTFVPIDEIPAILAKSGLEKYITIVCARGGVWVTGAVVRISDFEKGNVHYNYLHEKFPDIVAVSATVEDIDVANAQGVLSIAVSRIHDRATLKKHKPDLIIPNFKALPKILSAL